MKEVRESRKKGGRWLKKKKEGKWREERKRKIVTFLDDYEKYKVLL